MNYYLNKILTTTTTNKKNPAPYFPKISQGHKKAIYRTKNINDQ